MKNLVDKFIRIIFPSLLVCSNVYLYNRINVIFIHNVLYDFQSKKSNVIPAKLSSNCTRVISLCTAS